MLYNFKSENVKYLKIAYQFVSPIYIYILYLLSIQGVWQLYYKKFQKIFTITLMAQREGWPDIQFACPFQWEWDLTKNDTVDELEDIRFNVGKVKKHVDFRNYALFFFNCRDRQNLSSGAKTGYFDERAPQLGARVNHGTPAAGVIGHIG